MLVVATTSERAIELFVREGIIHEELFSEDAYGKSMNASFASRFWLQTAEDHEVFTRGNEPNIDEAEFKRRIQEF